jgi:hypothetical protein
MSSGKYALKGGIIASSSENFAQALLAHLCIL